MTDRSGLTQPEKYIFEKADKEKSAKTATPPALPQQPSPPADVSHTIASGLQGVNQSAQAVSSAASSAASLASTLASPGAALANMAAGAVEDKMNNLVSGMAAAMGEFPAATITSMALGIPHAHIKHPPSGPPPLPPIPLPPLGPILLGTNLTVLINGKPSARCGDYGINPTCCGILPPLSALFEIVTGSSNVYIGGARAARSGVDITMHCFNMPSPKISINVGKLAGIASAVGKVAGVAGKVAGAVGTVANIAGKISMATQIASSFADAEADDNAAMAAAIAQNVAMMAAQAAADAAASALTGSMGTDQACLPPTGTPGMILNGSANVLIGGFPLPSFSAIAQGLLKRIHGLSFTGGGGWDGGGAVSCPACEAAAASN